METAPPGDLVDPFGTTADPGAYVPLRPAERALDGLAAAVLDGASCVLLVGQSGCGKTMVLHLLEERLAEHRESLYLPYPALPTPALCAWAQSLKGWERSYDPVGSILAEAQRLRAEGRGLVLIVDDLGDMPGSTLLELAAACEDSDGALQLVGAVEPAGAAEAGDLLPEVETVSLLDPLSAEETRSYVEAHLGRVSLPEDVRARFDDSSLARLHERTGGVPRLLNAQASLLLRKAFLAPAASVESGAAPGEANGTAAPESEDLWEDADFPEAEPSGELLALAREQPALELDGVPELPPDDAQHDDAQHDYAQQDDAQQDDTQQDAAQQDAVPEPRRPAQTDEDEDALAHAAGVLAVAHGAPTSEDPRDVGRHVLERLGAGAQPQRERRPELSERLELEPRARPLVRGWLAAAVFAVALVAGAAVGTFGLRPLVVAPPTSGTAALAEPDVAAAPEVAAAMPPAAATDAPPASARVEERPIDTAAPAELAAASPAPVPVQINATPWATIRVDGREVGVTPLAGVPLSPGAHRFEARFPDGRRLERVVEIDDDNRHVAFP